MSVWLPYISSATTAVVAVVAIVVGRLSSKDTLTTQLKQRMWERRSDLYVDALKTVQEIDVREITPDAVLKKAARGGPVLLLPYLDTPEWREFSARVDALASDEVRSLFSVWERCLSGWSWCLTKAATHSDPLGEFYKEARSELQTSYQAVAAARGLLTDQIRSELRFESRPFPKFTYVAPEEFMGAITELKATDHPRVRQSPRIRTFSREEHATKLQLDLPPF